jgi:DDB1- and CUL4-associated factor 13
MSKKSALGSAFLKTALAHGLDFHPMEGITRYAKDANLDDMLLMAPDALFDPAWLNVSRVLWLLRI